jgi:hypothetical protein
VFYHLARYHKFRGLNRVDVNRQLPSTNENLEDQLVLPVEGVPVLSGYKCAHCTFYCAKQDTIKAHYRSQNHPFETEFEVVQIQKVFSGIPIKYYGILNNAELRSEAPSNRLIPSDEFLVTVQQSQVEDRSLLSSFDAEVNFSGYIEQYGENEAVAKTKLPLSI